MKAFVCVKGTASLGGDIGDVSILNQVKPLTGEPDAGNPPVRFGGRGGRVIARSSLPLSLLMCWSYRLVISMTWPAGGCGLIRREGFARQATMGHTARRKRGMGGGPLSESAAGTYSRGEGRSTLDGMHGSPTRDRGG